MKKKLLLPLLAMQLLQSTIAQTNAHAASPVVKTINGSVKGTAEKSGVNSFKGIPFSAPPVGNLRWKAPQPAANWQGVRDATQFGHHGMQTNIFVEASTFEEKSNYDKKQEERKGN